MLWCVLVLSDLSSVFFFKQKTAYEMRISDWSSDVCSSDLARGLPELRRARERRADALGLVPPRRRSSGRSRKAARRHRRVVRDAAAETVRRRDEPRHRQPHRSEEHTSELQSLMRNSYAVLC